MIIGLVKKFHAASLSQLPKRFDEVWVPAFTLLNKHAGNAVGYFKLLLLALEMVNLLENDAVGWKIALARRAFKHLSVQGVVKIQVGEISGLHLRLSQQVCMEVSAYTKGLMNLKDEADIRQC